MNVTVHASVFHGGGQKGDFGWMLEQPEYDGAFFIFNDNEGEFLAYQSDQGKSGPGCMPGGGNAAIRPWQCATPPRAGGIPTGSYNITDANGNHGYPSLTPEVKGYIDTAVAFIAKRIADTGCTDVYYSSDGNGGLGTHIFSPSPEVTSYIVSKINSLGTVDS
ncbi:hypothetical protein [Tropicibacter naphthalenivorans]|uniref:Uncharacterized protein n=1 Tax=Tropicibacter naphthalenivorans TaxID=441103 RepID=A0A0P1GPS4_9RHOB|nr:hypothetical protein [Tropicibacter naphthalenivorans]CUH76133.1 hypothetical protein TRN7648_00797 [Tropicibacter naphthalenivorans]SMC39838.1 hypothetical protein SAMN04488093_10187 [Tropicibacter naphthalenivorans]